MPRRSHEARARVAVYVRVSTADQSVATQLRELRAFCKRRGWERIAPYEDQGVSGSRASRPALDRLMADVRAGHVDVVVCWALDRLGRSVQHLVLTLDELASRRVAFVCASQGIDTTDGNPAGRFMTHVLSAVAEFERSLIRERVLAGVARARAEGRALGRPRVQLDLEDARRRLRVKGASVRAVARQLGTNHATLRRALAR